MTRHERLGFEEIKRVLNTYRCEFVPKGRSKHAKVRVLTEAGSHVLGLTGSGRIDDVAVIGDARQKAQRLLRKLKD